MTPRIILGGSGSFVLPVYEELRSLSLVAIVTQPDSPKGRGRQLASQTIAQLAEKERLPVFKLENINSPESQELLKSLDADLFLTASYGQFLGKKIRELFPHGSWNLHPSLLPRYRGAAPVPATLKAGDAETGVTLFKMVKQMDAGPLAAQAKVSIDPDETADQLLKRLAKLGGQLAIETIPQIIQKSIPLIEQNENDVTYAPKIEKQMGQIDWSQSATTIHNQMRAHHPWPGSFTHFKNQRINLFASSVSNDVSSHPPGTLIAIATDSLSVSCEPGTLTVRQLQKPGKKILPVKDFLNGTSLNEGDRFQ